MASQEKLSKASITTERRSSGLDHKTKANTGSHKNYRKIKSLKQKSDLQKDETEKLKDKVQEAASLTAERSSKCSEAVKVIKCIATQLKEVTKKLPSDMEEKESFKSMQDEVDSFLDNIGTLDTETCSSSLPSTVRTNGRVNAQRVQEIQQIADSNGSLIPHFAEGAANAECRPTSPTTAAREVIEQFELGVYMTLLQLTDGTKIFKQVKFRYQYICSKNAVEIDLE